MNRRHFGRLLATGAGGLALAGWSPLKGKVSRRGTLELDTCPVPKRAGFSDPDYYIWGGSMTEGPEGRYHLFYSRWPRERGFKSWVTDSEVARAVAENPLGPYRHVEVALPRRGRQYWDGLTTHNPTVQRFGDRYYLYYMGTTADEEEAEEKKFWAHRNNQRIGVAVADHPTGPWERSSAPLINVSEERDAPDALMASNPSVTKRADGRYLMVYKAVGLERELPFGGPVVLLSAVADTPTGPFEKKLNPIFTVPGRDFPVEDPFIWHSSERSRYYAIVKDKHGAFTGVDSTDTDTSDQGYSLALLASPTGDDQWQVTDSPLVSRTQVRWADGKVQDFSRLERPQLWFKDGRPAILFCAATVDQQHSLNVHIPLMPVDQLSG